MEPSQEQGKSDSEKNKSVSNQTTYKNSAEYINALEKWLQEAYMWQCVSAWFPYMLMSQQLSGAALTVGGRGELPFGSFDPNNGMFSFSPNTNPPSTTQTSTNTNSTTYRSAGSTSAARRPEDQAGGVIYRIPALWKRCLAEFLDFLLLFSAKLMITFIAVDFLDVIDLDKYDLESLQQNEEFDYEMALDMISELFVLELVHNVVACIFEAMCICRGSVGRPGGATPGKSIMGLRVVSSENIVAVSSSELPPHMRREGLYVRVIPGGDLGFWCALCRSFVKNFFLAFFFPVCVTMFFSTYNRTVYDNLAHSIVVEELPRPQN